MARKGGNIFQRILQLVLDKSSIEKTRRETQDALKKATDPKGAEENVGKLDKAFLKLKLGALAAATALLTGLAFALRKVTQESIAAQRVAAQQEAVLRSTGMAAGRTADQLNKQAQALSRLTTFQDDTISSAQNLLLTFRKIREEEFDKAVEVTLDFATAMGVDASSAALQLGKALQDPIAGLTALRRAGVSFSESQRETIKNLVETNRLAEAQRLILAELEIQFGGSAEAARNTLGGALTGLKNAWDDLFEAERSTTDGLVRFVNGIAAALPVLDRWVGKLLDGAAAVKEMLATGAGLNEGALLAPPSGMAALPGMGDLRLLEDQDRDDRARAQRIQERDRLAALEDEKKAQAAIAEAGKERREAEAKAHEARIREQEEYFGFLVAARDAGIATAAEQRQLQVISEALAAAIKAANTELAERVRLQRLLASAQRETAQPRDRSQGELVRAVGVFDLFDTDRPIRADGIADEAEKTKDAWVDALQTVGIEAQIASGLIEAAFSSDGFLKGLARVASAKAKENIARAIETAAGGLAAFVFGDPTKLPVAAKASAGFLAAAAAWGAIGAAGGGGGSVGAGGGFTPSAPPGRGVDRLPTQQSIHITQYIDGIDPKNGVHQEKVGDTVIYYNQRKGRGR